VLRISKIKFYCIIPYISIFYVNQFLFKLIIPYHYNIIPLNDSIVIQHAYSILTIFILYNLKLPIHFIYMIPYNCYVLKFPIHSVYMIPYNCYVFKIPIHSIHMIPYNCYVFLKFRIYQFF
jgi:hypothetical protein